MRQNSLLKMIFLQIECSNGQVGYGRRKRHAVESHSNDQKNEIFEMAMSMFIRVDFDPDSETDEGNTDIAHYSFF